MTTFGRGCRLEPLDRAEAGFGSPERESWGHGRLPGSAPLPERPVTALTSPAGSGDAPPQLRAGVYRKAIGTHPAFGVRLAHPY